MQARAVVTGAARGLGAAIAARLEAQDLEVVRLDLHAGPGVRAADVTDHATIMALAEELGPVDVLVNNAGRWLFGPLEEVSPEQFATALDVNLRGAFHTTQAFGRGMLERGRGAIVNITSIAARHANPRVGGYSASKAGLEALTRQTALEWGARGVRCNAVAPGLIPTPGTGSVYDDAGTREQRAQRVPLQRLGTPEDVAQVVAFLVSPAAAYVTGEVIHVDGGLSHSLMSLLARPSALPDPGVAR